MSLLFLLLAGALQAATLRVEGVGESVLVYVDGLSQGRTPITLNAGDGRHQLEFKKEEWQTASIRYGLLVDGQTKGKLTVDWVSEAVHVVWAEDIVQAKQEARERVEAERRAAEEERQAEEEERQAEEQARRDAEQARLDAEGEARRQAEEAAREAQEAVLRVQYMPHRERGVAAMKAGDRRTALNAFRDARKAGDTDKRFLALVEKLEAEIGTVRLQVKGVQASMAPRILLDTPEGEPFAPEEKG